MYELGEVARLFNVSNEAVRRYLDPVALAEINDPSTPENEIRAEWVEFATFAAGYFPASTLKNALGENFSRTLPPGYKTQVVALRWPNTFLTECATSRAKPTFLKTWHMR